MDEISDLEHEANARETALLAAIHIAVGAFGEYPMSGAFSGPAQT